jgi:hypothetical protein
VAHTQGLHVQEALKSLQFATAEAVRAVLVLLCFVVCSCSILSVSVGMLVTRKACKQETLLRLLGRACVLWFVLLLHYVLVCGCW